MVSDGLQGPLATCHHYFLRFWSLSVDLKGCRPSHMLQQTLLLQYHCRELADWLVGRLQVSRFSLSLAYPFALLLV